jgi:archaellum component FlaC
MDIQFIVGVITIIASMYGMLKFMLKDVHKEVQILEKNFEKNQQDRREEIKTANNRFQAMDNRFQEMENKFCMMQNRLDGLYRVLLDRTYGKNVPEELK